MYVAPRPEAADDPLFAIRLASAAVVGFALAPVLQTAIPALLAALPVGLMAGMRKAFDPKKAFGGPIALIVMVWLVAALVLLAKPMPMVLIMLMALLFFAGFYLIQRTGNPIGMLVILMTVLMSVMGMSSITGMEAMRDSMTEAALATLLIIPALYLVFPPRTRERMIEAYVLAPGHHVRAAAIRAGVQLLLCFWLYSVIDASNMILAVVVTFVLVFPTRQAYFEEARQRVFATILGALVALLLFCLTFIAHLPIVLLLVMLAGLYFGSRMMHGRQPPMVYQFAFSAAVVLVSSSLTTSEPGYAVLTQVVLTLGGAVAAALLTALLEKLLIPGAGRSRTAATQARPD